jgi:uncharacterized protein DUF1569
MKTLARQRDREEILDRLQRVRPDSEALWGRMSAHQMICHVADAFRMATGEKSAATDTSWFRRSILKWIVLYAPVPWPSGVSTSPEIDQTIGGTKSADFAADVAESARLLHVLSGSAVNLEGRAHPLFGKMSHAAWLRWGYLHADHHLRQFGA